MYQVKILLAVASICCLIAALLMLWNEAQLSLTFAEVKFMETLFILASIVLIKDYAKIKVNKDE